MVQYRGMEKARRTHRPASAGRRGLAGWNASDESLLAGLGTGDPAAASVFVRRFQARVHGVASSIVGDNPSAAEVSQEAFLRAWRHADAYDPRKGSVVTWLLAITRNLSIDRLRLSQSRPAEVFDALALDGQASTDIAPDDAAVLSDEARRVQRAVDQLSPELRRALLLTAVGGYTARELAAKEGIPIGTAKTRTRTALLRARDAMRASAAHDEEDSTNDG